MPRWKLDTASLLVFCGHPVVLGLAVVAVEAGLLDSLRLEAAIYGSLGLTLLNLQAVLRDCGTIGGVDSQQIFMLVGLSTHDTGFFFAARTHDGYTAIGTSLLQHGPALQQKGAHL